MRRKSPICAAFLRRKWLVFRRIIAASDIHERADWPEFRWNERVLASALAQVHFRRGQLIAAMAGVGFEVSQDAYLRTLTQDVARSSEIEGERLDIGQVRSSLARRLGLPQAGLPQPSA